MIIMPNNKHLANKPYRLVLDHAEFPDTCWNCKTNPVQVDTAFGPVCFGCEIILNALPLLDVSFPNDDVDTMTMVDADGFEWEIISGRSDVGTRQERSTLFMNTNGFACGVRVEVKWSAGNDWLWNVIENGDVVESEYETPRMLRRDRSLGYVVSDAVDQATETVREIVDASEGDEYVDGWDDRAFISDYETDVFDGLYV